MAPRKDASDIACSDTFLGTGKSDLLMADNFPSKVFLMIEHCDEEDSDVACWDDDGAHVIVNDTAKLSTAYLPRYFKHSNFQSFVRQLNLYGFCTVRDKQDGPNLHGPAPVIFHHDLFQRGRTDLLKQVKSKRSRTSHKKKNDAEEKQVDISHVDKRFDALEDQVADLSRKLDLLLSLVSIDSASDVGLGHMMDGGAKRRRQDSSEDRASSPGGSENDITTISEDRSTQGSPALSPMVTKEPRYTFTMDVVEENEVHEDGSANAQDVQHQVYKDSNAHVQEAHRQQHVVDDSNDEVEADDDFMEYIDLMLGDDNVEMNQDTTMMVREEPCDMNESSSHASGSPGSAPDSSTHVTTDPLMSKVNPPTVHGEQQEPQATASAITIRAGDDEFDEEAGVYDTSLPLTTAVEVNDRPRRSFTGTRIFIAILIVLVLIAAIVSPIVYFQNKDENEDQNENKPLPQTNPDNLLSPFSPLDGERINVTISDHDTNETNFDSSTDQEFPQRQGGPPPAPFMLGGNEPSSDRAGNNPPGKTDYDFKLIINGQTLHCNAAS